jgi:hypothetical protein
MLTRQHFVVENVVSYASLTDTIHAFHLARYSFVVSILAGAVYTFGFIMMTPQLFINYKMKSVAHLNWRVMTYKVCTHWLLSV